MKSQAKEINHPLKKGPEKGPKADPSQKAIFYHHPIHA
jgi:hypothetical protein